MAVLCPYNPKESKSLKNWCRWKGENTGRCPPLVDSQGLVQNKYNGRLAVYDEPGNSSYTVILNQLTTQDAGFYWCLASSDARWTTMVEIKVVDGKSQTWQEGREEASRPLPQRQFHPSTPPPTSPPSGLMLRWDGLQDRDHPA